jgi:DNA-binding PadR family transcriptional regulator
VFLRERQKEALHDIGRFRVVSLHDLQAQYPKHELDFLERKGLVRTQSVVSEEFKHRKVCTLTEEGLRHVQSVHLGSGQRYYEGIARPADLAHDAEVYSRFREYEAELHARGCKVRRVVLDYELQGKVKREIEAAKKAALDRLRPNVAFQKQVSQANGLTVVDGSIQYPDVRVEYENPGGELGHTDLEVVTENYSRAQIAAKQAAGMKIYGLPTPTWGPKHDPKIAARALEI